MATGHRYASPRSYRPSAVDDDDFTYMTTISSSSSYYNPTRSLMNRNHEPDSAGQSFYHQHHHKSPSFSQHQYSSFGSRSSSPAPYYPASYDQLETASLSGTVASTQAQFVDLTDYQSPVDECYASAEDEEEVDDGFVEEKKSQEDSYGRDRDQDHGYGSSSNGANYDYQYRNNLVSNHHYYRNPENYPNISNAHHNLLNYDFYAVNYNGMDQSQYQRHPHKNHSRQQPGDRTSTTGDDSRSEDTEDRISRIRRETDLVDLSNCVVTDRVSSSGSYIDLTEVPSILDDNESQESVNSADREWDLMQNRRQRMTSTTDTTKAKTSSPNLVEDHRDDKWEVQSLPAPAVSSPQQFSPYAAGNTSAAAKTNTKTGFDGDDVPHTPMSLPYMPRDYSELPAVLPPEVKKPTSPYGFTQNTAIDLVVPSLDEDDTQVVRNNKSAPLAPAAPEKVDQPAESPTETSEANKSANNEPQTKSIATTPAPQSPGSHPSVTDLTRTITEQLKFEVARHSEQVSMGDSNKTSTSRDLDIPSMTASSESDLTSVITARSSRTETSADPPGVLEHKPSLLGAAINAPPVKDPPGHQPRVKPDAAVRFSAPIMRPPRSGGYNRRGKNDAPATATESKQKDCPALLLRQLSSPAPPASPALETTIRYTTLIEAAESLSFSKDLPVAMDPNEGEYVQEEAVETVLGDQTFISEPDSYYISRSEATQSSVRHEIIVVDSRLMASHSSSSSSVHGRESRDDPTEKASNLTKERQYASVTATSSPRTGNLRAWMPSQANLHSVVRGMMPTTTSREKDDDDGASAEESAAESLLSRLLDDSLQLQSIPSYRLVKDSNDIKRRENKRGVDVPSDRKVKTALVADAPTASRPQVLLTRLVETPTPIDLTDEKDEEEAEEDDASTSSSSSVGVIPDASSKSDIFTSKQASFELNRQDTLSSGQVYCDQQVNTTNAEDSHQNDDIDELQESINNDTEDDYTERVDDDDLTGRPTDVTATATDSGLDAEAAYTAFCLSVDEVDHEAANAPELHTVDVPSESKKLDSLVNLWEARFTEKAASDKTGVVSWGEETKLPSAELDLPREEDEIPLVGNSAQEDMDDNADHAEDDTTHVEVEPEEEDDSEMKKAEDIAEWQDLEQPSIIPVDDETDTDTAAFADPIRRLPNDKKVSFKEDIEEVAIIHPFREPSPAEHTANAFADVWNSKMAEIADATEPSNEADEVELLETPEMYPGDEDDNEDHPESAIEDRVIGFADEWNGKTAEVSDADDDDHIGDIEVTHLPQSELQDIPEHDTASSGPIAAESDDENESTNDHTPEIDDDGVAEDASENAPEAKVPDLPTNYSKKQSTGGVFDAFADVWNTKMAEIADDSSELGEHLDLENEKNVGEQIDDPISEDETPSVVPTVTEAHGDYEEDESVVELTAVEEGNCLAYDAPTDEASLAADENATDEATHDKASDDGYSEDSKDSERELPRQSHFEEIPEQVMKDQDNVFSQMSRLGAFLKSTSTAVAKTAESSVSSLVSDLKSSALSSLPADKTDDVTSDRGLPVQACASEATEDEGPIPFSAQDMPSVLHDTPNSLEQSSKPVDSDFASDLTTAALLSFSSTSPDEPVSHEMKVQDQPVKAKEELPLSFCDGGSGVSKLPSGCRVSPEEDISFFDSGGGMARLPMGCSSLAQEDPKLTEGILAGAPAHVADEESTMQEMSELGSEDQFCGSTPVTQIQSITHDDEPLPSEILRGWEQDHPADDVTVDSAVKNMESPACTDAADQENLDTDWSHSDEPEETETGTLQYSIEMPEEESDHQSQIAVQHSGEEEEEAGGEGEAAQEAGLVDDIIDMSFDNESRGSSVSALQEPNESPAATLDMECLQVLVTSLMTHEYGFEFSTPVDLRKYPDYKENESKYKPLDLGSILRNLINGDYATILDFQADVNMTFNFRMKHSQKGCKVYKMAKTLKKKFEKDLLKLLDDLEHELTGS
ncbi:Transcription factor [Seminavis robusta]|uniref:Transcription factor n=1 Tax=Seminavis robusta TaxID=568900 RepID=A0A9N8D8E5_9STRA|nr:Transcription factor [Seminavis robusta]|eukprot:Sro1_g000870.1 Transcription factor (1972) ;mRNA; f:249892-255992